MVHSIRKETGHSSFGFLTAFARPLVLLALFYFLIEVVGLRGFKIRGSTVTFLLTGIFCFLVHIGTIQTVTHAIRKSRGMLFHAPASIFVYVLSQAFGALYVHLSVSLIILLVADLVGVALDIRDPAGLILPYFLSWASGAGVGLILMSLGHVAPSSAEIVGTVYTRVQFFTSGKFWAANVLHMMFPAWFADIALWNPLLHIIDQMRGAAFVNYFPKLTELGYPAAFTAVALVVGFMAEAWVRRGYSVSQSKR
ncbi:MAG TPA: hypothetical protein VFR34_02250, partial [Paracoccaceae bacterium]|nr:hypothetical protein [Paracoccaceae bacterium]